MVTRDEIIDKAYRPLTKTEIWAIEEHDKWIKPLVAELNKIASQKQGEARYRWNPRDELSTEIHIYMFKPKTENRIHRHAHYWIECDKLDDKKFLRQMLIRNYDSNYDSQEIKDYFGLAEKRIYDKIVAYNELYPYKEFMKHITAELNQDNEQPQEKEHEL